MPGPGFTFALAPYSLQADLKIRLYDQNSFSLPDGPEIRLYD